MTRERESASEKIQPLAPNNIGRPVVGPKSLGTNAAVRLGGDTAILLFGLVSATVSARILGPANKGTLSTLLYVQMLLSYTSSLGMADAVIITVSKGNRTRQGLLSALIRPLLLSGTVGALLLIGLGFIVDWSAIRGAVVLAALLVPLVVSTHFASGLENAAERFSVTTRVSVVVAGGSALSLWVMVGALNLGITGGVLAALTGSALGLALLIKSLRKQGLHFRPEKNPQLVKELLRVGIPAQAGTTLLALSQRVDLVIVYGLAGEAAAGMYTVALTLSQLASYASLALVSSAFPRMARTPEAEVPLFFARLSRIGLAAALISSAVLVVVIPTAVPVLFGKAYSGATIPALMLLASAVLWSEQWLLTRVALAQDRSDLYLRSFACSLVTMLIGDFLLVPVAGLRGAAFASILAPIVGIASIYKAMPAGRSLRWQELVPGRSDFKDLAHEFRSLLKARSRFSI